MRFFLAVLVSLSLFLPLPAPAADQTDLMKKIEDLSKQLDALKQQMQEIRQKETAKDERIAKVEKKTQEATKPSWLQIGGDYRGRFDYLKGTTRDWYSFQQVLPYFLQMPGAKPPQLIPSQDFKNDALMTNRFGINLQAKATEDVTVKARLLMYKVWGHESAEPVAGPSSAFFADKFFIFDGNVSHIPQDNILRVDQAYATWSNIAGAPVWFSLGRRPSTAGVPTNLRQNIEKSGSAGVPGLLIDYAFDGGTIGFAPDIQALPGSYAKICYGKGFDSGFRTTGNSLNDVNFLGINVVPYDTDNFRVELQWDRAFGIFAFPENRNGSGLGFGPNANLGDIDQYGLTVMGKIEKLGPGDLNLFADGAISKTHPNDNFFSVMTPAGAMPVAGLLYDAPNFGGVKEGKTGQALYLGARYDLNKTGTKLGLEYNYGSKNWVAFSPASDDMWTSKLGVHGSVYEAYLIQEIKSKPISKMGKAQFRLGYQYYSFKYTGSNNWVGAPKSMSDLSNPMNAQMFPPLKKANDIYLTFDVTF